MLYCFQIKKIILLLLLFSPSLWRCQPTSPEPPCCFLLVFTGYSSKKDEMHFGRLRWLHPGRGRGSSRWTRTAAPSSVWEQLPVWDICELTLSIHNSSLSACSLTTRIWRFLCGPTACPHVSATTPHTTPHITPHVAPRVVSSHPS